MVAILEKTEHNTNFHQIVDFLEAFNIRVETTDGETKILAKVNGMQRSVSESLIRRHLKLNDEEGISTLLDNELFENLSLMGYNILPNQRTVELFASMLVPQGKGSEHPSKPHQTPSDQDEPIHHEQITQPPQHEQTTSQEPIIPSQSHYVITTPRRITRGTIRISQSKVPSPGADETAFPIGDVRYVEAFLTVTRLNAGQDRENIAKTSSMPHEALSRVTSLGGGEGSMQQKLQNLMDICTSLQRQHSLMEERVQSQDLKITQLKTRVKTLEDNERRREGFAQEDAPNTGRMDQGEDLLVGDTVKDSDKSADKGSDNTDEMANVLGTLGAANILASGGLRSVFTTAILSVATASTCVSPAVTNASGSFPTAYQAQQNKPATKTERRNFYMSILRSNAGWKAKDFKGMTFKQIEEKFISVWEKMQDFVPMNSKIESERLKRPGIQLDKESFKKLKTAEASGISDLYASGERLSIDKMTHNFDAV
nr:hypothetical protein [Tanacetum cinerariifolium]